MFHACVTAWPALNDQVNVQLVNGSPRFVIDTFAPNPPCHCDDTAQFTEQPAAAAPAGYATTTAADASNVTSPPSS